MFNEIFNINNLPTLDLHGEIGDIARIRVNDFVKENYNNKNKYILIIHGKGTGVVKNATYEALKINSLVDEYKLYYFNDGCTIVKLKENKN